MTKEQRQSSRSDEVTKALRELADGYFFDGVGGKFELTPLGRSRRELIVANELARLAAALNAPQSTSGALSLKIPFIKEYRAQRDECADALRELVRLKGIKEVLDANDAGTHPLRADVWASMKGDYEDHKTQAWDAARAAVAKVPTYEQRLRNIDKQMYDMALAQDELFATANDEPLQDCMCVD